MVYRITVLDHISDVTATKLRALLPDGFTLDHGTARGDAHMMEIIADTDFAIAGQVGVSSDVFGAAKRLKLLHKWGVGYDNLDLEAARRCGIKVARTTGSNALAVAEFTMGLLFSVMRHVSYGHMHMQRGVWVGGRLPRDNFLVSGKTVGIVGFGAIGSTVAKLLQGFGCNILYSKQTRLSAQEEARLGVTYASFDEIIERADIITLHCPLTPQTTNLFNADVFRRMKKTAVLINVARGGVVDEDALVEALKQGEIHAAAADVFAIEPLPADSSMIGLDNLVLTPHLAAGAAETFTSTVRHMFRNMQLVAAGKPVPTQDSLVD